MDRVKEPSTWAGFAALLALFKPELADALPALLDSAGLVAGSIAASVAIFRRERG